MNRGRGDENKIQIPQPPLKRRRYQFFKRKSCIKRPDPITERVPDEPRMKSLVQECEQHQDNELDTNDSNAHWAKKPKKAFAIHLLTLLMTLSPSLCSLSFLTSSPSLSVTPSDHRVLSQPLALPIYLNKLSLDDSLHAISSNLGV